MTGTDPIPDRAELRERAAKRIRLLLLVPAIAAATVVLAFGVAMDGSAGTRGWIFIGVGLVLIAAGAAAMMLVVRRRLANPELVSGLDRSSQREVARALRNGRTDDPRVDAIIRQSAARVIRTRWLTAVFALVAALDVYLAAEDIADRDWDGLVFRLVSAVLFTLFAAYQWNQVRRYRAYLRQEGPARPADTAA
ncbi:hypothetical protein [Actinoplanes sp. RD1]|uniref:hypothetical protein n=1 Tax=Actinoplanes sp. RD1 TaxID=3064538 RepID=UPI0027414C52|nr:hypothetical protein [Actinoplanes sp. RD1]